MPAAQSMLVARREGSGVLQPLDGSDAMVSDVPAAPSPR
jgi:hypothetical protein